MNRHGSCPRKGYLLGTWLLALWLSASNAEAGVPILLILVFHRFIPAVWDSMTVHTSTFEAQLQVIAREGFPVISLRQAVKYLAGTGAALPPKAVVFTVDDGYVSIYLEMLHDRMLALPRYLRVGRYDAKAFSLLLRRATEEACP